MVLITIYQVYTIKTGFLFQMIIEVPTIQTSSPLHQRYINKEFLKLLFRMQTFARLKDVVISLVGC